MIEKAASPWVTLPTIALALVTAVTECRKAVGYPLPPGAEGAIATVAAFLLGWLKAT